MDSIDAIRQEFIRHNGMTPEEWIAKYRANQISIDDPINLGWTYRAFFLEITDGSGD